MCKHVFDSTWVFSVLISDYFASITWLPYTVTCHRWWFYLFQVQFVYNTSFSVLFYLLSGSVFVFRTALYCKICIIFELESQAAVEHLLNIFISFKHTALCISEALYSGAEM